MLLAILALSLAGVNVLLNYVARDFMTAFSLKEKDEFFRMLVIYLLTFALATPITVFYSYTEQRLGLLWRRWLSHQLLTKYFDNLAFYKIGSYEGIDNPDQRIEEDVRSFTTTSLSLFLILTNAFLTMILFIGILWTISLNLVISVVLYALFGSIITYLVGRPLINLNFDQLRKEADYRYKLVNIRDNAESIGFYRGGRKEFIRARQRLKVALRNFLRIINLNRNLGFFIQGYNYIKPVLPIIIVSPLYLDGQIEFGVVTQAADAFLRTLDALSILVQHFGTVSAVTAVVTRLGSFNEALDDVHKASPTVIGDASSGLASPTDNNERGLSTAAGIIEIVESDHVEVAKLTILTPKRERVVVQDMDFTLRPGGMLITGASGRGKSSVLRAFAGLWQAGSGRIYRPPLSKTIFLPQRPYMILGTFRNQFLYPLGRKARTDSQLEEALDKVSLLDTLSRVGGFDAIAYWPNILSTGEQQRLAFCRLLLLQPEFAFLDEATTALDHESEKKIYEMLGDICKNYVSVGFRATLSPYHNSVLELLGGGKWQFSDRV
jgi:vitamin B12/bleomycin/antimicrobial peptide transport system ATP-binding/permease protein